MMKDPHRCDSVFKRSVLDVCYNALERQGFIRFKKDEVDWPLHDGFHCWVGLNTALNSAYVEVNPFVGIHVVPIMKMHTSLEGRKYNRGYATYAIHLGEVAPDEDAFRFTLRTNIEAEARRLAMLYTTVGLGCASEIATYEALLPLLEDRIGMLGGYPERVACCLYLMGRINEAQLFAETFLAKEPNYFDCFAQQFLKMIRDGAGQDSPRRA